MELQRRQLLANGRLHAERAVATLLLLVVAGSARPAHAQLSVEVSPLRVELETGPGASTTQPVSIRNTSAEPLRVRASLSDWTLTREGAPQFGTSEAPDPYSATGWVRLAPPEQIIPPGEEALVRFTLTVPAGTPPASYRTSILFEFGQAGPQPAESAGVMFKSRIATLVYLRVGDPQPSVELMDLHVREGDEGTQTVAVLRNAGRRSVRTRGTLVVLDAGGNRILEAQVPDVPVLPESEREVVIPVIETGSLPPLEPGTYRVEVRIDVGQRAVLVGETVLKVSG